MKKKDWILGIQKLKKYADKKKNQYIATDTPAKRCKFFIIY